MMSQDHKFQVDLRGVIGVLSGSLYSGPRVFIRELLQNATDALRERQSSDTLLVGESDFPGNVFRTVWV